MPVLGYRPKLKNAASKTAKTPGPDLTDTQMTCCLMMGVGGPLVMIAGAVYLFALHQMDRLLFTSVSKTDMPGFETGIGFLMLCLGGVAGIAGGFFYCEGEKTRRWKAEQEKKKKLEVSLKGHVVSFGFCNDSGFPIKARLHVRNDSFFDVSLSPCWNDDL